MFEGLTNAVKRNTKCETLQEVWSNVQAMYKKEESLEKQEALNEVLRMVNKMEVATIL